MAKRTVVWTETAAQQRRHILKYWVKRNGTTTYAEKLIKLTAKQIKIIQSNPKIFKKADFPETYVSALGHFSIFYKFTNELLIITAFWDNRQDPKKLLDILIKSKSKS
jgi:plasmid stabilization system protein ParE